MFYELGTIPAGTMLDAYHLDRYLERNANGDVIVRQLDGRQLARLSGLNRELAVFFTPDDHVLALVDEETRALLRWTFGDAHPTRLATLTDQDGEVTTFEFSRDASRLLIGRLRAPQGVIEVVDWTKGLVLFHRQVAGDGINTQLEEVARIAPDGLSVAVVEGAYGSADDRFVRIFEVDSGSEVGVLVLSGPVESVAWHPDGQTLAIGLTRSNDIELWNIPSKQKIGLLDDQRGGGPLLTINASGELLSSYSSWAGGGATMFWRPYSLKPILQLTTNGLQFRFQTDDGRLVAVKAERNGRQHIWVAEPSPVMQTLVRNPVYGKTEAWRAVSVHPNGRVLAVGSDNGVSLFDLQTGQDIGYLPVGHALWPCFIPESGELLTHSPLGLLRWPVQEAAGRVATIQFGPPERLPCPAGYGTEVASDVTGRVIAVARASNSHWSCTTTVNA